MSVSQERVGSPSCALLRCPTYAEAVVQDAVRRAVDLLNGDRDAGGLRAYVKPGRFRFTERI